MKISSVIILVFSLIGAFALVKWIYKLGCKLTEKIKALIKNKKRKEKN